MSYTVKSFWSAEPYERIEERETLEQAEELYFQWRDDVDCYSCYIYVDDEIYRDFKEGYGYPAEEEVGYTAYGGEPDEWDEFELAMQDCGQFMEGGILYCSSAGSEECDFECPFRHELYKPVDEIDAEAE